MSADPLAQIRTHLRHAARIIRRNGLNQGGYFDDHQNYRDGIPAAQCRVCMLGAVNIAVTGRPWHSADEEPISAAVAHLSAYIFVHHPGVWIADWNDQPGRTAWQVALLLRRAAAWTPATVDTLALAA